ncbi:F-box/LRR-repeat protein 10 [Abeliophyllum distichum]|uniref:F-box/LRR-repeat protein 10 n=1 Tax=Abeliophyllum distichum TaxID=126358 RepID=A0ABD1UIZ5_9LAMI
MSLENIGNKRICYYKSFQHRLRLLDLYNCVVITQLAFRFFKKPYFPILTWLEVIGFVNRDMVDDLARSRPFLYIACRGKEFGTDQWDDLDDVYMQDLGSTAVLGWLVGFFQWDDLDDVYRPM